MNAHTSETFYFIGIGGIGMSGIAEIMHGLNYRVAGSDQKESVITRRLQEKGIRISTDENADLPQQISTVVVSSAIREDHPQLAAARARSLPIMHRAGMLALLMRSKSTIAIAGSHGKTSTTSLGASVLTAGGLDPTVINGGVMTAFGSNAHLGKGDWMIVEADESDGSFVKLPATHVIITNMDPEHMDHYPSFDHVRQDFLRFIHQMPAQGLAILCHDHPEVKALIPHIQDRRWITYGLQEGAQVRAVNVQLSETGATFNVCIDSSLQTMCPNVSLTTLTNLSIQLLGIHNVQNALSIIALALELGLTETQIRAGLEASQGVNRRFTKTGEVKGITIIDDYAHHPVEIKAVLKAARLVTSQQIIAVFQPHRYSRLRDLYADFLAAFEEADQLLVLPVYSAGEDSIADISAALFVQDFHKAQQKSAIRCLNIQSQEELIQALTMPSSGQYALKPQDLILFLGAGDSTVWAQAFPTLLSQALGLLSQELNPNVSTGFTKRSA